MSARFLLVGCICAISGIVVVKSQIIYRGKCPKTPLQENFNLTKFSGTWHEVSRSFMLFQMAMRCVETEFTVKGEGAMDIKIRGLDSIGLKRSYDGTAHVKDADQPAKMKAIFKIMPMSLNYNVVKTDYESYAVMWSCNNIFGGTLGHTENLWLLSRTPMLKDDIKHEVYQYLDSNKVARQFLERNAQQNKCPSYKNFTQTVTTIVPSIDLNSTETESYTVLGDLVTDSSLVTDTNS